MKLNLRLTSRTTWSPPFNCCSCKIYLKHYGFLGGSQYACLLFEIKVILASDFLSTGKLKPVYESTVNTMQNPYKRHVEYVVSRIAPLTIITGKATCSLSFNQHCWLLNCWALYCIVIMYVMLIFKLDVKYTCIDSVDT